VEAVRLVPSTPELLAGFAPMGGEPDAERMVFVRWTRQEPSAAQGTLPA
jgi:hypothetical protein